MVTGNNSLAIHGEIAHHPQVASLDSPESYIPSVNTVVASNNHHILHSVVTPNPVQTMTPTRSFLPAISAVDTPSNINPLDHPVVRTKTSPLSPLPNPEHPNQTNNFSNAVSTNTKIAEKNNSFQGSVLTKTASSEPYSSRLPASPLPIYIPTPALPYPVIASTTLSTPSRTASPHPVMSVPSPPIKTIGDQTAKAALIRTLITERLNSCSPVPVTGPNLQ